MRPQSFRQQMPRGGPFNQFQGPRNNFGYRPGQPFPQGMMPPPGRGPAPGLGTGTKGAVPKLDSFMDTANRFLATAQSFQPLVQQASPMFRNLPAIWKLYKGFKGLPKTSDSNESDREEFYERHESSSRSEEYEDLDSPENYERPEKSRRLERPEKVRRPDRPRKRDNYKDTYLSESPTYHAERVKPKKESNRPSIPRIFQPRYPFDE